MHKLTLTLFSVGILTLGGCVYGPYQGYYSETDEIWADQPQKYGARDQQRPSQSRQYAQNDRDATRSPSSTAPYRTYTGTNRYGSGGANSRQSEPGAPARLTGRVEEANEAAPPQPPRDRTETAATEPPLAPPTPGGFNRANPDRPAADALASAKPPAERNMPAPGPAPTPPPAAARDNDPPPPASSGADSSDAKDAFGHLPFAIPVPGKAGYVTLPGAAAGTPQIDVRGISPGTPVEIPDPKKADSTIQFRVP